MLYHRELRCQEEDNQLKTQRRLSATDTLDATKAVSSSCLAAAPFASLLPALLSNPQTKSTESSNPEPELKEAGKFGGQKGVVRYQTKTFEGVSPEARSYEPSTSLSSSAKILILFLLLLMFGGFIARLLVI